MTDNSNSNTPVQPDSTPDPTSSAEKSRRVPLWQAIVLPVAAILIFFLLLEGGLAVIGFNPPNKLEDPFVGFSANVPLFVPAPGPDGSQWMTTSQSKSNFFNTQRFPLKKPTGTFRIFTLGGSTTYGRPYNDATSFTGWLREFLPRADRDKHWEVINAGGISYASYRVAHLMEELITYQPDLFIIYTGHNEFLEDRTYGQIKEIPSAIRSTVSLLAKTRTWGAMSAAMRSLGIQPEEKQETRNKLAVEVNAILDKSAGLERYTRDDPLKENILKHFRLSLERMAGLARSVGARVVFVTPASSLNDCTPFKSEHTDGLNATQQNRSDQILKLARQAIGLENWETALAMLDEAVSFDPRYAELHYRRGQALLAARRYEEADTAFRTARDEDVCPLRALTPVRQIVADVAAEQNAVLVDFVEILGRRMLHEKGYRSPGEEYFLDHVHPTIGGHKILALALLDAMIADNMVHPAADWNEQAIASVTAKVEAGIDRAKHGQALANLARVMLWSGKLEDAARLASQAQQTAGDVLQVAVDSASILTTYHIEQGQYQRAVDLLHAAIENAPGAIELHMKLGQILIDPPFGKLEEGSAHMLVVCQQLPNFDDPFRQFGLAMAKRNRMDIAYASLMEALRLNPGNSSARMILGQVQRMLQGRQPSPRPPQIMLDLYPSMAPRKLVQVRPDAKGRPVPHGIEVEFHENGRIKHYADYVMGEKHGLDMTWSPNGKQLTRTVFKQGVEQK